MTAKQAPFLSPGRAQGMAAADRIDGASDFDEVVVGDWLHAEAMDRDHVWIRVGPLVLNVTRKRGVLRVRIERDGDGEVVVDGDLGGAK